MSACRNSRGRPSRIGRSDFFLSSHQRHHPRQRIPEHPLQARARSAARKAVLVQQGLLSFHATSCIGFLRRGKARFSPVCIEQNRCLGLTPAHTNPRRALFPLRGKNPPPKPEFFHTVENPAHAGQTFFHTMENSPMRGNHFSTLWKTRSPAPFSSLLACWRIRW